MKKLKFLIPFLVLATILAGTASAQNVPGLFSGRVSASSSSGGSPVSGPGSSTNNALAVWNGTGGNTLANSVVLLSSGAMSGVTTLASGPGTFTGTGSSTLADATTQPATFSGGGAPTAGNMYGISIQKSGAEEAFFGINKNTTTGEIPANAVYLSTYVNSGQIAIGRGNSAGSPNSADLLINGSGDTTVKVLNSLTHTITSSGAASLAVGRQGATSPAFVVDASASTSATGVKIAAAAAAGGVTVSAISSGTDELFKFISLGTGELQLASAGTGSVKLRPADSTRLELTGSRAIFTPTTSTAAANARLSWTGAANTSLTAGTEFSQVFIDMGQTNQHASNTNITTQRDFRIAGMTHSFASATGTIADRYVFSVDAPSAASTNAVITRNWSAGFGGAIEVTGGVRLVPVTVSALGSATVTGVLKAVSDASSGTDCTSGGGSTYNLCMSNGSAWVDM